MSEGVMTVEEARRKLREYRELRGRLKAMTQDAQVAARIVYAAGDIKADILREVGWSRPWLDGVLDGVGEDAVERA